MSALLHHFNDEVHTQTLATAKVTLLKPNRWLFDDGFFYFWSEPERLALVGPVSSAQSSHQNVDNADCDEIPSNSSLHGDGTGQLVIPGVLLKDEVSDLVVRHIGVGKIGARFCEKDGVSSEIRRIWCEWLGNVDVTTEDINVIPEHEFAVVTFSYNYNLGIQGIFDLRHLLPSSRPSESLDTGCSRGKETVVFSDAEDTSEELKYQDYIFWEQPQSPNGSSSGEESQSSNNSKSELLFTGNDDQLVDSLVLSSKAMRKLLRNQERIASRRTCEICKCKMMNKKTGKLVFHTFHVSCLIHWIMICELGNQLVDPKVILKRFQDSGSSGQKQEVQDKKICSVLCPPCQGTGMDEFEKPSHGLSQFWKYYLNRRDAQTEWVYTPELLQNCSLGLCFPSGSVEVYEEKVATLKLLHFYRA
ncbi:hypothetical protein C2S51_015409 [Perilla frutescens var. frutescens]|nr:hypothetical protein C2S51_015409 [Perilla frutescens var. frutescens]